MFENVCKIHVQCNKNCSAPYIGVKEAYGIKDRCKLKEITILTYQMDIVTIFKSLQCLSNVYIVSVVKL